MKKLFFSFLLLPVIGFSQNFHFSARLGMANYQGDLKEKAISFKQARLLGSIGARYDLSEKISARSYLTFTSLTADDKNGNNFMKQRNLNFKTGIVDWELTAQYGFFSLNEKWWTPYVFAGIGLFHYKPYTDDAAGNKTFLQPLSTEGQGFAAGVKEYKLTQFTIPFGVGAEYSLNEDMRIGIELGYRKTFTDYIDDVSKVYIDQTALLNARGAQAVELAYRGGEVGIDPYPAAGFARGNPKYKDGYYYFALTYSVRYFFDKYKQIAGLPSSKRSKKVGCPATRY
jgi:Domain of unknown function (DUF6089)